MANRQRDAKRETWWRELLARHAGSGLNVRAFCLREKLNESSFYAWRRTIQARDREGNARSTPAFVPAIVMHEAGRAASIALELGSGYVLRWPTSAAVEQLADLVVALQQRGAR